MGYNPLEHLLHLGIVVVVAVGGILFLLRMSGGRAGQKDAMVVGYPPDLFPEQHVLREGALVALATTQSRLVSIYRQLPVQSELAIWLRTFLLELREIMDAAYRAVVIMQVYGQPAHLERVVEEVQHIEMQVAEHVSRHLLAHDADAHNELLNGRLAALRLCVQELSVLSTTRH